MPSYLSLLNWTEKGIGIVKDSPQRVDAAKQAVSQAGGRIIFVYMLMGEHDIAVVTEFPDDQTAARFLLGLAQQGNVRSTTMKAFTENEMREIIGGLP